MAHDSREPLIKVSVVGSAKDVNSVLWKKQSNVKMNDHDVDDVAFLTGVNHYRKLARRLSRRRNPQVFHSIEVGVCRPRFLRQNGLTDLGRKFFRRIRSD